MSQDNNTPDGAPPDDITSALFVSARKKQLEQQEAERIAREKEEQRLAAEAEVQRLELEVEERRRRVAEEARLADEEARRIEEEARAGRAMADEEARRVAEEAQAENVMIAGSPGALPGGAWQSGAAQGAPPGTYAPPGTFAATGAAGPGNAAAQGAPAGLLKNKKALAIIGGIAVLIIALVVVLIVVLSGGPNSGGYEPARTPAQTPAPTPNPTPTPTLAPSAAPSASPSASAASTAPQPSSVWDIYGYYYLDGDPYDDNVYFYSDGTMEIYYSSSGATDTWDFSIDGDRVVVDGILYGTQSPYIFNIIDEDTLVDAYNDYYTREDDSFVYSPDPEPEPEAPRNIDPDAHLDSRAVVDRLAMGFWYPSSQYGCETNEWGFQLTGVNDDRAEINIDIILHTPGETTNNVRERIFGNYYTQLTNIDVFFNDHIDDRGYGMFEMTGDAGSTTYYLCGVIGAWTNESTGVSNYYAAVLICPAEESEDYFSLFWRIFESRHDV